MDYELLVCLLAGVVVGVLLSSVWVEVVRETVKEWRHKIWVRERLKTYKNSNILKPGDKFTCEGFDLTITNVVTRNDDPIPCETYGECYYKNSNIKILIMYYYDELGKLAPCVAKLDIFSGNFQLKPCNPWRI